MTHIKSLDQDPDIARYLTRIRAKPRTLKTAVVEEHHGTYWKDLARITIDPITGEVKVRAEDRSRNSDYEPNEKEAKDIAAAVKNWQWPQSKLLPPHAELPVELRTEDPETIFKFFDRTGSLVMLQHRKPTPDGGKVYHPWTYFDDDEWRRAEPDGKLPLWGLENLTQKATTVFVHEGAKAARRMHRLVNPHTEAERREFENHPWSAELSGAVHLGWIGGALNPHRTDWSVLQKAGVKVVYIVEDNDKHGRDATPKISRYLGGMHVFAIRFNEQFNKSFDMGDDWPETLFEPIVGERIYKGPMFKNLMWPATWATDVYKGSDGKLHEAVRDVFAEQWGWITNHQKFVCIKYPFMQYDFETFNRNMRSFCRTKKIGDLLLEVWDCHLHDLIYRPMADDDIKRIVSTDLVPRALNYYVGTNIKPKRGSPQPFKDFLKYMFPDDRERKMIEKWLATLIAHPEVRMTYSLLLISKAQGIGKTMLCEFILTPLVGRHNTEFPTIDQATENRFNDWVVGRRLIIINEVYAGKNWKAYNNLKSYVTDTTATVEQKYEHKISKEICSHFVCCSNDMRALKLSEKDRRWLVPTLTEQPWEEEQFREFYAWLQRDGLGIIKQWAIDYGDYVIKGQEAPDTPRKIEIQKESMSESKRDLVDWCAANASKDIVISTRSMRKWMEDNHTQMFETTQEVRRTMEGLGWVDPDLVLSRDGLEHRVMMSPAVAAAWAKKNGEPRQAKLDWLGDRYQKHPIF